MTKKSVHIIFPHQLFKTSEVLNIVNDIILIEEYLFFNQYKFHQQKNAFHRASMKSYEDFLIEKEKSNLHRCYKCIE